MIYVHSLGRASRYYAQRTALVVDSAAISFKALHERVQNIAATLRLLGGDANRWRPHLKTATRNPRARSASAIATAVLRPM